MRSYSRVTQEGGKFTELLAVFRNLSFKEGGVVS